MKRPIQIFGIHYGQILMIIFKNVDYWDVIMGDEIWTAFHDMLFHLRSIDVYYTLLHWSPTTIIAQFTQIYESNSGERASWTPQAVGKLNEKNGKISHLFHVSDPEQKEKVVAFMNRAAENKNDL